MSCVVAALESPSYPDVVSAGIAEVFRLWQEVDPSFPAIFANRVCQRPERPILRAVFNEKNFEFGELFSLAEKRLETRYRVFRSPKVYDHDREYHTHPLIRASATSRFFERISHSRKLSLRDRIPPIRLQRAMPFARSSPSHVRTTFHLRPEGF